MISFNFDVVDIAIASVGLAMLPMLPDLLANLLVAFLPDSHITSSVLQLSRTVRTVTTKLISRVLVLLSLVLPFMAVYFQPDMVRFRDSLPAGASVVSAEYVACVMLLLAVEGLYFKIVFTSPGYTPLGPSADSEKMSAAKGERGLCKRCDAAKPPRAHHCSVCGRCVLRMDHHCPFTNCCVGLLNERFFVLWVFCVWLGCLYGTVLSWQPFVVCIFGGIFNGIDSLSAVDLTRCTVIGKASFILLPAGALLSFMTILFFWHLFLISQDWTTIEFFRFKLGPLLGTPTEEPAPKIGRGGVWANYKGVFFPDAAHHAEMGLRS